MASYGKSFQPGQNGGGPDDPRKPGGRQAPIQQAIRLISTRLPSVIGARALAPSALLNSPGGGGFTERDIRQIFQPSPPPALPPSPSPAPPAPPWLAPPPVLAPPPQPDAESGGAPPAQPSQAAPRPAPTSDPGATAGPPSRTPPPPRIMPGDEGPGEVPGRDAGGGGSRGALLPEPSGPLDQFLQEPFTDQMGPMWLRRLLEMEPAQAPGRLDRFFTV